MFSLLKKIPAYYKIPYIHGQHYKQSNDFNLIRNPQIKQILHGKGGFRWLIPID